MAQILRADGHRVFMPTLTGMGERAHLAFGEPVGLETHIADIVAVLEFERLYDVVLCAASYGGLPATGAADRAVARVPLLVYVDGLVLSRSAYSWRPPPCAMSSGWSPSRLRAPSCGRGYARVRVPLPSTHDRDRTG